MKLAALVHASLVSLLLGAAAMPVRSAEDSNVAKLSAWFQNLRQGLQNSAISGRQQRRRASAVAAVRGDEQTSVDPNRPAWKKSTKSEKAELRKEKNELAAAVDLIVAGKYEEGASAIDAFEKAHPKSSLLDDARKAKENAALLAQLRGATAKVEAPAAAAKEAAAAPAAPTEAPKN